MDLDEQAKQWLVDNALPPPPVHRRYLTNDSTVEKLAVLLEESPHGLMIFRDELVGFLKKLDKDGYESDRAFYLEGWNGNGDHAVDRISRGSSIVKGVCLSVFGGIQPGVVAHWLNQATRQGSGDDGLIQRFQLLVWPDEPAAYLNVDTVPDLVAKHRFYHLVEQLACLDPVTLGAHQDEFDTLPYLHFSQEAQPIFSQWNTDLRNQAKDMHTEPALAAHLAKYPKLIPALALICHLASGGNGPVSETALLQALAWGDYLASHAKRAYTAGNLAHVSAAKEILKRIRKGDLPNPFTAHTVKRKNWGGLDSQTVDYALDELEECGYLQRNVERGQGRPKEWFFINPHCLGEV